MTGLARALDLVTINNALGPTTRVLLVPGIPSVPDSSNRANLAVLPRLQSRFSVISEGKSETLELSPRRLEQSLPARSRNWEVMIRKRDNVELLQSVSSIGFLPVHHVPYNSIPRSPDIVNNRRIFSWSSFIPLNGRYRPFRSGHFCRACWRAPRCLHVELGRLWVPAPRKALAGANHPD